MGMDIDLLNFAKKHSPKFNEDIINGLATKELVKGPEHVSEIFKTVARDFPEHITYEGWEHCTPYEELEHEPRSRATARIPIDVSRSSIYMINFIFTFDSEIVKLPVFMPHPGPAGSLMLSSSRYYISPVLTDVVYSYDKDRIYIQFRRAKFHIATIIHGFVADGTHIETDVSWSVLYHMKAQLKESRKVALLHYILGNRGVTQTFAELGKCKPIFGYKELNLETYPGKKWVHFNSTFPNNRNFKGGSHIRCVILRKEYESNKNAIDLLMSSLYYILDCNPDFLKPDELDDPTAWRIAMSDRLFDKGSNQIIALEQINKHFDSLDRYVDDLVKPDLERIGMKSDTLYDFLGQSIMRMDKWKEERYSKSSVLYGKELSVLYHVFQIYNDAIFRFYFELTNEIKKGKLTKERFIDLLRRKVTLRFVFNITKSGTINIGGINYPGENKAAKCTASVTPQTGTEVGTDGGGTTDRLHISVAEFCSTLRLSKDRPDGKTTLNPMLKLSPTNALERDPAVIPFADAVQERINKIMLSHVRGIDETFTATDLNDLTDMLSVDSND